MAKISAAKPSLIPAFLALLIIILFGYLIFSDLKSTRTEHTVNPPIEIIDPKDELPLTIIDEQQETIDNEAVIQKEAELFVDKLSPATELAISIKEDSDQFVRHNSLLNLPNIEQRHTTLSALLADKDLMPDTPITLDFSTEHRTNTTLQALSDSIEDHTAPVTIISSDGQVITQPLADILNQQMIGLNESITLVEKQRHHIDTTFADLSSLDIDPNQSLLANITLGSFNIAVNDLIPDDEHADGLYYIHRVTDEDAQGLWGIIQTGLIDKFRQGLRIDGLYQNKELVQAIIPADADEKLPSGMSSFLGKILNNKVDSSYIYNFHTKVMGRDANLIHPGQQVILIQFSASELTEIYQYFSDKRNQGTKTFAITD